VIFRSRRKQESATALAEPTLEAIAGMSTGELIEEIDRLSRSNRVRRDPVLESRLIGLRHLVALRLMDESAEVLAYPKPAFGLLPSGDGGLPEIEPGELTPELVRAGILRDGCLLVRGVVDRSDAFDLGEELQRAFAAREAARAGAPAEPGYYQEFEPDSRFVLHRDVVGDGGIWAADSPHLMFSMLECFEKAGLRRVISGYLGESPAVTAQKCTLRRVDPDAARGFAGHGWHQDGAFMGEVRALNVWLALSRCGDEAPGLDVLPKRLDHIIPTGTEGALFDWSISPSEVEEAAKDTEILRPIFEPGDVLLFDDLFLHSTAADPSMPKTRLAIESWFFGSSASPEDYAPLAA
jgi:hypothetical protein